MKSRLILRCVLKALSIYLLILWAYVVATVIVRPEWQFYNLTVYLPIHEDIFAMFSFAASFFCFIGWQYLEKVPN